VLSFPGPDRSIRMEDLRVGKAVTRRYRNRRIGEFLKELELTEGRSTGIPKMLRVMEENGSPPPEFETDDYRTSFLIRLPAHAGATPQVTPQVGTKSALSRHQVEILRKCLVESTLVDLMAVTGRTDRTKFRNQVLASLMEKGLIEMTIPDKPRSSKQRYTTTERGAQWLGEGLE
ncbi:transcriptional regulator, partial [Candidatus Bipolaricaulota bacterium]|nr:transcriptional regulator [Candidatus Bipolaricaulota bacterium]